MDHWVSWGKRLADEEVEEYHIIEEAYFSRTTNSALQSSIVAKFRTVYVFGITAVPSASTSAKVTKDIPELLKTGMPMKPP